MMINGKTKLCGLIGNPVEHTLSPLIHNTLAELKNDNLAYVPFPVEEGNVKDAIEGAAALGILGLNVTVPYKSEVIPYIKEIDGTAERIGAVNTLVRIAGGYKGYNTDMPGLYRAMQSEGISIMGECVILLGAGGAARAVAMMLAEYGVKRIYLLNRTLEHAERIAEEVNALQGKEIISAMELGRYRELPDERYLAVQCTSVGLYPHVDEVVIEEDDFYKKIHTAVDLIYNPAQTKFLRLVAKRGGRTMNGLKMLLYQGVIAYELWTGQSITEVEAQTILEKLKKG